MWLAHLSFMESLSFDFPLLFQTINHILISPANFVRKTLFVGVRNNNKNVEQTNLDCAVFTSRFQTQHAESIRNNHAFLTIVWRGNSFEKLQPL